MADNELFSAAINHSSFDDEGLEILPLITKERTQRFELLLHLIPNLKQHIILLGASGIGKTLLLDMLYDLDSEAWQCCFVQGSVELSFETVEAQLTKTMRRNKHESLDSALHNFKEQNKKIVLIIDDAGLSVSGLMTTLVEYAAAQPAIKLIFSLTPEARNSHRQTDKALDDCYLLELPSLSKPQCAYFLRHLAAKPRTYSSVPLDEKLQEKIYRDSQGIPAKIIESFTKLSRKKENDHLKWIASFIGLVFLAAVINQGVKYFNEEAAEDIAISPVVKVESIGKTPVVSIEKLPESQAKPEQDIVIPEFKLDIEKTLSAMPAVSVTQPSEIAQPIEPKKVEEPVKPDAETAAPQVEQSQEVTKIEPEKAPEEVKTVEPKIEPTSETAETTPASVIETVAPKVEQQPEPEPTKDAEIVEPEKPAEPPVVAFPKIAPAKGMKIQPLPEKSTIKTVPISVPDVKKVKIEPVKKVEIKPIEKPAVVKKPVVEKVESVKIEPVKKVELKTTPEVAETPKIEAKVEPVISPEIKRFALQLITLSSDAAVERFQKNHAQIAKNVRIVKSGTPEKPRFGLMYGGFSTLEEAATAREKLPAEFSNALPRKLN